jgi:hypothetical protein
MLGVTEKGMVAPRQSGLEFFRPEAALAPGCLFFGTKPIFSTADSADLSFRFSYLQTTVGLVPHMKSEAEKAN